MGSQPAPLNPMKSILLKLVAMGLMAFTAVSCTTGYDAYGRPSQNVDPLAAAAVAGVAGYAIGQNNRPRYYYSGGGYYGPHYYGGYYGRPVYPYRAAAARRAYYLRHH